MAYACQDTLKQKKSCATTVQVELADGYSLVEPRHDRKMTLEIETALWMCHADPSRRSSFGHDGMKSRATGTALLMVLVDPCS